MGDVKRVEPAKSRGGKWVLIGDEEYRVPALALLAVQDLQEQMPLLVGIRGIPDSKQMGVIFRVIHSALQRNYPDLSLDEVMAMIDIGNFNEVLTAVFEASGFKKVDGKDAKAASGETKASTGDNSTLP